MKNISKLKITNPAAVVTPALYNNLIAELSLGKSITPDIKARSGGQAKAVKLFSDMNIIGVVPSPGDGVKLPDVVMGLSMTVQNAGINDLYVYPYETDKINSLAANAPYTLKPGDIHIFDSLDSTKWLATSLRGPAGVTGTVGPSSVSSYDLGVALPFSVLTGGSLTVSNSQLIIPTGNIGEGALINPGNITFLSGSNGGTATSAVSAANVLYTSLAGLTADYTFGATNFESVNAGYGVKTFIPGIYRGTSYITTSASQTISLVGDGDYLFISDATINFGANTVIELKNGAQADRIFWIAAGAITTGATNVLKGNFITPAAINVGATNDIEGRLISTISAAITIDGTSTIIHKP